MGSLFSHGIEILRDTPPALSVEIMTKNISYDLRLFLYNDPTALMSKIISQHSAQINMGLSLLKILLKGPPNVLGDAPALLLRQCRENREDQFPLRVQCVDVFLFEVNAHRWIQPSQLSDAVERIQRIACEARDGFGDDIIQLSLRGILHHLIEPHSFTARCPGQRLIRIDTCKFPFFPFLNQPRIKLLLCRIGSLLRILSRGYPTIGCYSHFSFRRPLIFRRHEGPCGRDQRDIRSQTLPHILLHRLASHSNGVLEPSSQVTCPLPWGVNSRKRI